MVTGFVGGVFCFAWFGDEGMYTWWWAFVAIPLSFVVGVVGSLLAPDDSKRADAFYAIVGEPWG